MMRLLGSALAAALLAGSAAAQTAPPGGANETAPTKREVKAKRPPDLPPRVLKREPTEVEYKKADAAGCIYVYTGGSGLHHLACESD